MIEIQKTELKNVLLIRPKFFEDFRGQYIEIYNENVYRMAFRKYDIKEPPIFVEDDISTATRGVIKGIHGDTKSWKLISCPLGAIYVVVINYDVNSDQYGKWQAFTLSDVNKYQILVPPKYGNGHQCLSEKSMFLYKQSEYYDISRQFSIKWNDESFNIWWPIKNPILSQRDEKGDKKYVEK